MDKHLLASIITYGGGVLVFILAIAAQNPGLAKLKSEKPHWADDERC